MGEELGFLCLCFVFLGRGLAGWPRLLKLCIPPPLPHICWDFRLVLRWPW